MKLTEFDFALVVTSKIKIDGDTIIAISDSLFEAGAEDCTISSKGNFLIIEFDREAESFKTAVISAIKEVNSVNGLKVKSVDAGQYVGLSDAAELSQLSRSALSKFSKGERGKGGFPTPYLRVDGKAPLYDWAEIAQWLEYKGILDKDIAENAKFTAKINLALKLKPEELDEISHLMSII